MLQKLLSLYPNATTSNVDNPEAYFSIEIDFQWLHIPKADISLEGRNILLNLFGQPATTTSTWLNYLLNESNSIPECTWPLRFIYINVTQPFNHQHWRDTFMNADNHLRYLFAFNATNFIGIIEGQPHLADMAQLESLLATLAIDFEIQCRAMLGQLIPHEVHVREIFKLESRIFSEVVSEIKPMRTESFSNLYLRQHLRQCFEPLNSVYDYSLEERQMIHALYIYFGNLSKAAKYLFIHRNTLNYRIQKFYEKTGYNLNDLSDLIFTYYSL